MNEAGAARLVSEASEIPGGYWYHGICSSQLCFPLKAGGELRIMMLDDDESDGLWHVDFYGGELPPGITGPVTKTGKEPNEPEEKAQERTT